MPREPLYPHMPKSRQSFQAKVITVTCPICGKVIQIPDAVSRSDALGQHLRKEHTSKIGLPHAALPQIVSSGTCYQDAWRFVIKEGEGYLVHGTVWSRDKRIGHAWVETETGWIWEPETKKFYTKLGFENVAAPVAQQRYTPTEAAIMAARTKHHGPWSEQERRQHLGVRPGMWGKMSPMTAEEGEPVAPQYRHLVSLVSEPLPREAE